MKAHSSPSPSQIDARAREWFVRSLDKDMEADELLALEQWLEADSRHREAYQSAAEAWGLMVQAPLVPPSAANHRAEDHYHPGLSIADWRRTSKGRLKLASGAAMAATLVIAAGLLWSNAQIASPQLFSTQRADKLDARLQDGSRIRLGALTTVKVAYSPHRRDVGLSAGEALFQVAHDRTRPFVVHTPLAAITAVGTAFDVDVGKHGVTLIVTEGVVSVAADSRSGMVAGDPVTSSAIQVFKGQKLRMERDGARLILALDDSAGTGPAWTDGRLEYRNAELQSVVDDVNRYASKQIVIGDADLANLHYTGSVQLGSVENWVLGLPAAFPLKVELSDRGQFVLRRESPAALSTVTP